MVMEVQVNINFLLFFLLSQFVNFSMNLGFQSSYGTAKHVIDVMKDMLEKQ